MLLPKYLRFTVHFGRDIPSIKTLSLLLLLFCYYCCNDYHCYPHHYLISTNQVVALWRYRKKAANGAPFVYECSELVPCASVEEQTVWCCTAAFPTLPYPILFLSTLSYPIPSYSPYPILFLFTLSYPIHPTLPYPILFLFTLSYPILSFSPSPIPSYSYSPCPLPS